eukprot:gene29083-35100_t
MEDPVGLQDPSNISQLTLSSEAVSAPSSSSIISKYIERFRFSPPTAPQERQVPTDQKAFWWIEEGNLEKKRVSYKDALWELIEQEMDGVNSPPLPQPSHEHAEHSVQTTPTVAMKDEAIGTGDEDVSASQYSPYKAFNPPPVPTSPSQPAVRQSDSSFEEYTNYILSLCDQTLQVYTGGNKSKRKVVDSIESMKSEYTADHDDDHTEKSSAVSEDERSQGEVEELAGPSPVPLPAPMPLSPPHPSSLPPLSPMQSPQYPNNTHHSHHAHAHSHSTPPVSILGQSPPRGAPLPSPSPSSSLSLFLSATSDELSDVLQQHNRSADFDEYLKKEDDAHHRSSTNGQGEDGHRDGQGGGAQHDSTDKSSANADIVDTSTTINPSSALQSSHAHPIPAALSYEIVRSYLGDEVVEGLWRRLCDVEQQLQILQQTENNIAAR